MVEPAFSPSGWTEAIAADIAVIADGDTPLDWYQAAVVSMQLGAMSVLIAGRRVGTVLWKVDQEAGERCFVIVAAVGRARDFDLTRTVLPRLESFAQCLQCKRLRFHTQRKGLVEKARHAGYGEAEYVMRKRFA